MSWMERIAPALESESLLTDPGKSAVIPGQIYCPTLDTCRSEIARLFRERKWEGRKVAVFVDGVPKKSAEGGKGDLDAAFRELLTGAGISFEWMDLSDALSIRPEDLHASHSFIDRIRPIAGPLQESVIVTLGSGSITDLVKHALFLEGSTAPLISVPTALTVTAFTSSFAVLDFHGAKRTLVSRPVTASFWVEPFLAQAPERMSRAGYGDLLARFVAYADWFVGHRLGVMDRYDEMPYRLMEPFVTGIKANAPGFRAYPLPGETTACTATALAMAGIAMSVAGETTPLSGFEHVISHGLDFLHLMTGRELVLHGEQVALGSVISARTIDWLLRLGTDELHEWRRNPTDVCLSQLDDLLAAAPLTEVDGRPLADIKERIDAARAEFHAEYRKKSERWLQAERHCTAFTAGWEDIKREIARITIRGEEMERLAASAGLPLRPGETTPPTTSRELDWAVRFSPFVRSRTNLADLIFWMGKNAPFAGKDGLS